MTHLAYLVCCSWRSTTLENKDKLKHHYMSDLNCFVALPRIEDAKAWLLLLRK